MCLDEVIVKEFTLEKPEIITKFVRVNEEGNEESLYTEFNLQKRDIKANVDENIQVNPHISGFTDFYKAGIHGYKGNLGIDPQSSHSQCNPYGLTINAFGSPEGVKRRYLIPAGTKVTVGKQAGHITFVSPKIINPRARPEVSDFVSEALIVPQEVSAEFSRTGLRVKYKYI